MLERFSSGLIPQLSVSLGTSSYSLQQFTQGRDKTIRKYTNAFSLFPFHLFSLRLRSNLFLFIRNYLCLFLKPKESRF